MRNQIASEFRKLLSTRSAYWLLAGLMVVVGIGAASVVGADAMTTDLSAPLERQPFLLFPLRLESRFMGADGRRGPTQLCVRVFPDTCLVDTFEPELTEAELASAKLYWTAVWLAGGSEDGEQNRRPANGERRRASVRRSSTVAGHRPHGEFPTQANCVISSHPQF